MEIVIPKVTLNSGRLMPILGMGTASFPAVDPEEAKAAILNAIKTGYGHFDTASAYQTEKFLGEAIAEAFQLGLIRSRDEIFITSKLWCTDAHPDLVVPALQNSLRNLKLEYLDLYLIHFPVSLKPMKYEYPPKKEHLLPMDYKSVWAAMEECQKLGLTKSIGVSNFSCKKLQTILDTANISPAVNQVEMNPVWQNLKLREFCKAKGIVVTAYSPLGASGTPWGSNAVKEAQELQEIAKARGKTHAQVSLRWVYEQGVSLLVKSFNEQRMKENLMIFDWELTRDDLVKISKIRQRRGLPGDLLVSELEGAPFKTIKEFWDGETEMETAIPKVTLSSGSGMPIFGMGTASYPAVDPEEAGIAILNSIKVGYRHFDRAAAYQSEEFLGEAIAEALQLGLIKSRDELFITSKLWCTDAHPDLEHLLPMDYKSVWAAMEECQILGLTKSIGVSNFSCKKLQIILDTANIPPAVNQVEMNPLWQNLKLRKFCKINGIFVTGYSPLGASGTPWGSDRVKEAQDLHEIAQARRKTHAQVCLRWVYEQGVGLLAKSFNEQRMKENLMIFDWQLSENDLVKISKLPQRRSHPCDLVVSELQGAPFKTVEELWDGEV
ncbi:hypothetical protein MKX01_024235 [Papaver californicum]|nr:hypothetical protein MKX01_024235 [Papaver californicum]